MHPTTARAIVRCKVNTSGKLAMTKIHTQPSIDRGYSTYMSTGCIISEPLWSGRRHHYMQMPRAAQPAALLPKAINEELLPKHRFTVMGW